MTHSFRSWGTVPTPPQVSISPSWRSELPQQIHSKRGYLPVGNGRSYGDSCLNADGTAVVMTGLNRFISFNTDTGVLRAEAGVQLTHILQLALPQGWFLPVSPGTAFVTLGGAVANDVHGKNHHCDGTFGRFVNSFELLTSDGVQRSCSPTMHSELFSATIGGLGLTGVITTVEIQLLRIQSSWMDVRYDAFRSLQQFAELSAELRDGHRYSVAWMDCVTPGTAGRGVLMSANHATTGHLTLGQSKPRVSVPFSCPAFMLNRYSIRAFNAAYYRAQLRKTTRVQREHYQPFFYPLDSIGHWNRIYGSKGFHQYQFVVPIDALSALQSMLEIVIASGNGSFLAVLKEFGNSPSPGMLSFPRPGYCLALDFSHRGAKTEALIQSLDARVRAVGGAAYPAKDRLMSAQSFQQYFPEWTRFTQFIDPACSSDFWRRVSGKIGTFAPEAEA